MLLFSFVSVYGFLVAVLAVLTAPMVLCDPYFQLRSPVSMTFILKNILKLVPKASTTDLEQLIDGAKKELSSRKLADFVEYIPDYLDTTLGPEVFKDCESLHLSDSTRKASSQWLSLTNEPYVYPDSTPVHHAQDIRSSPAISKVLDLMNSDPRFNGSLDSCLILKYCSSSTSTSLHADDEDCLDQSRPICNLTLGASRRIEFFYQRRVMNLYVTL